MQPVSDRARDFLNQWQAANIEQPTNDQYYQKARQLAFTCWREAVRLSISSEDLSAAADGNLVMNMLERMKAVAEADVQ